MATKSLTHLPHIKNVKSGINKYDPVHNSIYEVYFTLPDALKPEFAEDEVLLTEQVTNVGGLNVLQKTTPAGEQKFYGVTVSYLNPVLDQTAADITIDFNLNLRNVTDNFVLKLFKAWENLSYNLADGTRSIKVGYISDNLRIAVATRNGDVWRSTIFHHIMLTNVESELDALDYQNNDAMKLHCTFRCDYWEDELSGPQESAA
jgi:hypothetical protein